MFVPRLRATARRIALAVLPGVAACSGSRAAETASPPPPAEFLLSTADSTFWITTTNREVHVRGAPLVLARFDGRFYELYTADEDRSYNDALLVGERLYRRDLMTGDSVMVFTDTTVSHVAEIYSRTHPDERPLAPDEEGKADPQTSATAELDILDVFGPFLSYEYHVDITLPHRSLWHTTRRGVLDLRTGKKTLVGDLIGVERSRAVIATARQKYETVRDSALRARTAPTPEERRALAALERRQFDPSCFALENVDGQPALAFAIPGAGEGKAGDLVELEPVAVDSVDGWRSIRSTLAIPDSDDDDRWVAPAYSLIAHYDTSGQFARLTLRDSTKGEWLLGSVTGPLLRVDWLDRPALTNAERTALRRAFDAAANYDENARVASLAAPVRHADRRHALGSIQRLASAGFVTNSSVRHTRPSRSSERRDDLRLITQSKSRVSSTFHLARHSLR